MRIKQKPFQHNRDYTEYSAIQVVRNHAKMKFDKKLSNNLHILSGSVGIKVLGAIDYLHNFCGYSVRFDSQKVFDSI